MKLTVFRRKLKPGPSGEDRFSDTYYCKFRVRGKQYLRKTGLAEKNAALTRAKKLYRQVEAESWGEVEKSKYRNDAPTVAEILAIYKQAAPSTGARIETANDNARTLLRILKTALPKVEKPETHRVSALIPDVLEKYIALRQKLPAPDRSATLSQNAGINSDLRKVKSVFGKKIMPFYAGLKLPDLSGFLGVQKVKEPDHRFSPIPHATIGKIKEAAAKNETDDPGLYLTTNMALCMGLRSSEIIAARRHWVELRDKRYVLKIISRPGEYDPN